MQIKNIISDYLKEENIVLDNKSSVGLNINYDNNEVVIKGTAIDLIELADLLVSCALSDVNGNHIHIDDLTLIDSNSDVSSLIIEKNN